MAGAAARWRNGDDGDRVHRATRLRPQRCAIFDREGVPRMWSADLHAMLPARLSRMYPLALETWHTARHARADAMGGEATGVGERTGWPARGVDRRSSAAREGCCRDGIAHCHLLRSYGELTARVGIVRIGGGGRGGRVRRRRKGRRVRGWRIAPGILRERYDLPLREGKDVQQNQPTKRNQNQQAKPGAEAGLLADLPQGNDYDREKDEAKAKEERHQVGEVRIDTHVVRIHEGSFPRRG